MSEAKSVATGEGMRGRLQRAAVPAAVLLALAALVLGRDVVMPARVFVWHLSSLAWFVVILAAAWGQGRTLAGLFLREGDGAAGEPLTLIALGLGLGLISVEAFLLGAVGLLNSPSLTLLLLVALVFTVMAARGSMSGLRSCLGRFREIPEGSRLPLALAVFAVLLVWPFALVPTRAFDALSYHLEVPLRYLQSGRVLDIPENLYSYAPQLNHMLYGLAMGVSGADLAGMINHLYFIMTLLLLWSGFRGLFSAPAGAWAAAFGALSPMMLIEAANPGVDWSAAFYTLTALSVLAAGPAQKQTFLLAGILAGMAAGCRHQPIGYAIVIPLVVGIFLDVTGGKKGAFTRWGSFLIAALAAASPWYLRNWVYTGDPIFPLFSNLLGSTETGSGFVSGLVGAKPAALLWQWIVLPFRMVFDPLSYSMTATLGVQYLVFIPLLLFRKGEGDGPTGTGRRSLAWWLLLAFLAWYLNFRTARYAMPVILVSGLWLGEGLAGGMKGAGIWGRLLKPVAVAVLLLNAGVFLGLQDVVNRSVGAALGTRSPVTYIEETYRPYRAIEYLNNLDPAPGRVLFVGEMRGFYSGFQREVPSHNVENRLIGMVRQGLEPGEISRKLAAAGVTHLLVNKDEWYRMAYRNRNAPSWLLDEAGMKDFDSYLAGWTRKMFEENGVAVYRIIHE